MSNILSLELESEIANEIAVETITRIFVRLMRK
jgi:hypothetical protein